MVDFRGRPVLEWSVAGFGVVGGVALMAAGADYGLSSPTGVAPGTFPAVAGALLCLSGVFWLIGLLRHVPVPAHETALELAIESALGADLTDRVADVETRAEGHLELDGHPIPARDDDGPADPVSAAADRQGLIRVFVVVVAIAVAAALLSVIGFVLVMTLLLVTVLVAAGRQPLWRAVLVGLAAALVTRYVFGDLLGVSLPTSPIPLLSDWGI